MKKNKFYILLAILALIFLFSFSALCNKSNATNKEKVDVSKNEESSKASENSEGEKQDSNANSENKEDNSDNQDNSQEEEEENSEAEAPTIDLEIYEGPVYSAGDDVCYYRIKANVTGKPSPNINFSKDDSNGAWGSKKVQINLNDPSDSYTLTATATNSEGSASDSITLSWGCNRPPIIASIVVDGDPIYISETYHVTVNASDPDGNDLTVTWSVSSGTIDNVHANPMNWTTPAIPDNYDIKVVVDDGNGETVTLAKTIEVLPVLAPPIFNMDVPHVTAEGGYLENGGDTRNSTSLYAGDSDFNKYCVGYISYDISSLAGTTITDARLTLTLKHEWGDPSFYNYFYIGSLYWGPTPIDQGLASTPSTDIQGFSASGNGNFICTNSKLVEELQKAIDNGQARFQIRIYFTGSSTNNNNDWDGWEYSQDQVVLNVTASG